MPDHDNDPHAIHDHDDLVIIPARRADTGGEARIIIHRSTPSLGGVLVVIEKVPPIHVAHNHALLLATSVLKMLAVDLGRDDRDA